MKTHNFVCPECKHEWSEEFGYDSDVLCRSCQTVWRLVFDKTGVWPPAEYRIDGRAEHQPQFDVTIDGTKIPSCMLITVEQESFAAHSLVQYRMVARFYDELDDDLINLVTGHSGDVTITLLGHHPEIKPMTLHVQVGGGLPLDTLTFHTDGAGFEFAREQMKAMWEKANKQ